MKAADTIYFVLKLKEHSNYFTHQNQLVKTGLGDTFMKEILCYSSENVGFEAFGTACLKKSVELWEI